MIGPPECFHRKCKHFWGTFQPFKNESVERISCEAFPYGIPEDIFKGKNPHTKKHPEQNNNITYEKATTWLPPHEQTERKLKQAEQEYAKKHKEPKDF